MIVSVSWLKKYVDIPVDTNTLISELTMLGLNVERSFTTGITSDDVVIGRVLEVVPHPNADRLCLCQVDVGSQDALGVVCGADNVAAGQFVPVAMVGASLANGLKIRKSKIRGEVSNGMICSQIELGLGEEADGIMVLEGEYTPGAPASQALGSADVILELEITPNRPDQLSHIGVAREISALYEKEVTYPYKEIGPGTGESGELAIDIDNKDDCFRYVGRVVRGVSVGPSPAWLKSALEGVGLNSVNNIVDVANYVMLETGQPLHAFDLAKVGRTIGVRKARKGEKLKALDEVLYELEDHFLIITSDDEPTAIAGVIGGLESAVSETTTDILIESAAFDPRTVRKTRKSMNISTDASYRFERGSDRSVCLSASDRACELIMEIAGGTAGQVIDAFPSPYEPKNVVIRRSNTRRILGVDIEIDNIVKMLERLFFKTVETGEDTVTVQVPCHRLDIVEEADLIEEVARLHGYEHIGKGWGFRTTTFAQQEPFEWFVESVSDFLAARGFTEVLTSAFTDGREAEFMGWSESDPRKRRIAIKNPLTPNHRFLRTSLLPGALEVIRKNFDYGTRRIDLFGIGKVFLTSADKTGLPDERTMLVLARTRPSGKDFWKYSKETVDLFDIKQEIESIAASEGVDIAGKLDYDFERQTGRFTYSGREGVVIEGEIVSPELAARYDLDQAVWYALADMQLLFQLRAGKSRMAPIPEYPVSKRDLSLVTPKGVTFWEIEKSLVKHGGRLLESIRAFDVYEGGNVPSGSTAFGVRLLFRSADRTLTDGEVDKVLGKMVQKLQSELGVVLRS